MNIQTKTDLLLTQANSLVAGKAQSIRLMWVALLCGGHVLLEDVPGVGKTTLAQGLAALTGLRYKRVQFTSDMLPSDIIGAQIYERQSETFRFHQGPVFTQMLLADELNRATPKAQSALLEAMEEGQVSIDGQTHALPTPFFVIATQNPQVQTGTYPLPESQLDRFFIRIALGYPSVDVEKKLLKGEVGRVNLAQLTACITAEELHAMSRQVRQVSMSEPVLDYIMRLVSQSRDLAICESGLSPRASQALALASQAYALSYNRDYVVPDDVQAVFEAVAAHRLKPLGSQTQQSLARQLLDTVDVLA